jgi:hypothetical protein
MATFTEADHEAKELLVRARRRRQDLNDAGVTVKLLFAYARVNDAGEQVGGPALKLHGYPCLATVKINPLKDRVEGKADATITLDADQWPEHGEAEKLSLLDHELTHLELARTPEGEVRLDDAGRPKLKMRLHDMVIGGFYEVIRRHGEDVAFEGQQYAQMSRALRQQELFADEPALAGGAA